MQYDYKAALEEFYASLQNGCTYFIAPALSYKIDAGMKLAADMQWRPIETAPRNGCWLGLHSDGDMNICKIEYGIPVVLNNGDYDAGGYGRNYKTKAHNEFSDYERLTHWMPVPKPPQTEEKAGEW